MIARGNTIIQLLNGRITSMLIDDDTVGRKLDGLIGIQVHKGPPMKIEVTQHPSEEVVSRATAACQASRRWPKSPGFRWARSPT